MRLKIALRSLRRNPRRTLTVALTVAVGTGSLFMFHGFNFGIMNQYRENTIRARYGYGQINLQGYREQVFEKPWEHWIGAPAPLLAELTALPGVKQVFPRVEFPALLTNGRINVSGRGQGIDGVAEASFFNTLNVEEGKTLSNEDQGILLGRGLARALNAKVGDRVTVVTNTIGGSINGVDLNVVGVFHTGSKDFDDVVFRVPLARAQTLLDTSSVESVALGLDGLSSWPVVERFVHERHPELEATPFAVLDKVYYQNAVDWLGAQFGVIQFIILGVVVLGIFNTVSSGVLERKQEIGNLRANGDSVGEILALLCAESFAVGVLGAFVGIAGAWILNATLLREGLLMPPSPGITRQFHVRIELQLGMALVTFVMGSACCLFGAWLAGWRVARMPIGEALRSS